MSDAVTFDSFLDFATAGVDSGTEVDVLEDFVLRELYKVNGHDSVLTCSSAEFKLFCRDAYEKAVHKDGQFLFPGRGDLISTIRDYITASNLWYEFAEYLEKKDEEEKK